MQKKQTHLMYGAITGMIVAVLSLIFYITGLSFKYTYIQYIIQIPFLVGIIMNGMAYSKANDGFVTFGNIFGSCFKASMIVALIILAWSIISMLIFPEMKDKAMEMAHTEMAKNPKMTDEQMEMSMSIMRKYWTPLMVAGAIFGTLFYGAIFSLIGGAVAKKKGERPVTAGDNF
jgi:uncharacterized membrane protein YciS (DUF1049 family)